MRVSDKGRYSDDLSDYGPDRQTFGFGLRWWFAGLAFILILATSAGVAHFAFGWLSVPGQVFGVENVRTQFQTAYDDINSLNAVAANICIAEKQRNLYPVGTDGYNTGESNVVAQEQNFQRIENHYNAYVSDPFRAKLVRPRDLPYPAPTEAEAIASLPGGGCS